MAKKQKRSAESWRYVLFDDRELPDAEQSVFVLRPLTQAERAEVQDNLVRTHRLPDGSSSTVGRTHRITLDLCLTNIEAIENFPAGSPEAWPRGREERAAYLEGLDDAQVHEIGNEIWAKATLGDEVKNSSAPGGTSPSGADSAARSSTTVANAPTIPG